MTPSDRIAYSCAEVARLTGRTAKNVSDACRHGRIPVIMRADDPTKPITPYLIPASWVEDVRNGINAQTTAA